MKLNPHREKIERLEFTERNHSSRLQMKIKLIRKSFPTMRLAIVNCKPQNV